jgi:hypothetical protein
VREIRFSGSPTLTPLTPHLTRSHQSDELLELLSWEVGTHSPQPAGDVFAHDFLAERVDFGHAGVTEGVLL